VVAGKAGDKKKKFVIGGRWTQNTYLDRGFELQKDRLRNEDFTSLGAEETDLRLQELHLLARTAAPHLQKAIDD
jgi:hypothetical protein